MRTVVPSRMLGDLASMSPELYQGLPERMPVEQQARFLDMLCNGASQHHACSVMGIPLLLVWRERKANPEFDSWLTYVLENARPQALEEIAVQFATQGIPKRETKRVDKPIIVEGHHLGNAVEETVTEGNEFNSHSLLQFMLRGQQREKYGTTHVESNLNVKREPVTIRDAKDAQRLLAKVNEELRKVLPAIDGEATEVVEDDGSDLV